MRLNNYLPWRRHHKVIKLFWFRRQNPGEKNFGDELSAELVRRLSGKRVEWASKEECEMVAIGSVLQALLTRESKQKVTIWGSGSMFEEEKITYDPARHDIRLVRGNLTAKKLEMADKLPVGDPALVADLLYRPSKNLKKIGIVPHYVDKEHPVLDKLSASKEIKIIDVFGSPEAVCSEIASCELVLSSSLHGIIVAQAFGVPAYWVEFSDKVAGKGFKFRDHYSVFGLEPATVSIAELGNITQHADRLINNYTPPTSISNIQEDIISSFPKDL